MFGLNIGYKCFTLATGRFMGDKLFSVDNEQQVSIV